MGKVILDAETRAKLNGLTQQLELYDEQGNLLGVLHTGGPATSTRWTCRGRTRSPTKRSRRR